MVLFGNIGLKLNRPILNGTYFGTSGTLAVDEMGRYLMVLFGIPGTMAGNEMGRY